MLRLVRNPIPNVYGAFTKKSKGNVRISLSRLSKFYSFYRQSVASKNTFIIPIIGQRESSLITQRLGYFS